MTAPSLSRTDLAGVFARLAVVYGDTRIADKAQRELLLREWLAALGWYAAPRIHDAVSAWIKTGKFWPAPAELLEIMRADNPPPERHTSDRLDPPRKPFCRDGRSVAEEIAYRDAQIKLMKRGTWLDRPGNEPIVEFHTEPKPVSQEGLTPEFIALAKRQGIYSGKEPTP